MTEKQDNTLSCDTSRTVMFHMRWDVLPLKIWKNVSNYLADVLKLARDAFTSMNATGGITFSVIIMSLETQLRCLLLGKKMYLEVKRTSRKWPSQNTSASSGLLQALPQTLWIVAVYKHTLKCFAEQCRLTMHFKIVIKNIKGFY